MAPSPDFSFKAPAANPVFYRTYSRKTNGVREEWQQVVERNIEGMKELGHLTPDEVSLLKEKQLNLQCLPSGRWMWVGGSDWIKNPQNFSGAYNCTSTNVIDWDSFGLMMDLAMMGSGTGAILEPAFIKKLPVIRNKINIVSVSEIGTKAPENRLEFTEFEIKRNNIKIIVGDSRVGWVDSYLGILQLSADPEFDHELNISIDLTNVRPSGERLNGFGGVANPIKLKDLYARLASILNGALERQLTSVECCLLIDEAAVVVVAGNVRRSAGMRQFNSDDDEAAEAKDNLWQQKEDGSWCIDPERDALRMANHTRVFHAYPSYKTVEEAVTKQFYSGEGAIQFAPEAIARSNVDLLTTQQDRETFIGVYCNQGPEVAGAILKSKYPEISERELEHRLTRYGLNPCGEIIGSDFHCNLSEVHLNNVDPFNYEEQEQVFKAGAIAVATLLNHSFVEPRYADSRALDPIVGVSFTGLFDFFVHAFGADWLKWWEEGRPDTEQGLSFKQQEAAYLVRWKETVHNTVWDYCDRHGLRRPNRCTTVQPAGTKSLLTNASPGWHPPKAQRFIRRITFRRDDAVALACMDYGYTIVPSQSDKDEEGRLLDDPFDPRCTEWLVEIPTEVSWANLLGADTVDISKFSALAQFDFYMQVQNYYTAHNTSATIEYREHEIEDLSKAIYDSIQNNKGYISAALLARFDANETFPRLPFEPITKQKYEQLQAGVKERQVTSDFFQALLRYDKGELIEAGPAGCDGDKCLLPLAKPE